MERLTRFNNLVVRECYRFLRLSRQTIFPPLITTLLFILIFGYSLGSHIREIKGFPYIVFILPGLAAMGTITNSYANTSTSLFMARLDLSIENMVAAPLSNFQLVTSLTLGGLLRGLTVGLLTLLVAVPVIDLEVQNWNGTIEKINLMQFQMAAFSSCVFHRVTEVRQGHRISIGLSIKV